MQAIKHYGLMYTYSTAQEQIFYQSAGSPKIHEVWFPNPSQDPKGEVIKPAYL